MIGAERKVLVVDVGVDALAIGVDEGLAEGKHAISLDPLSPEI